MVLWRIVLAGMHTRMGTWVWVSQLRMTCMCMCVSWQNEREELIPVYPSLYSHSLSTEYPMLFYISGMRYWCGLDYGTGMSELRHALIHPSYALLVQLYCTYALYASYDLGAYLFRGLGGGVVCGKNSLVLGS